MVQETFSCSRCRLALTVPLDMLGKWVRCPQCQESFLAADAPRPLDLTAVSAGKAPLSAPALRSTADKTVPEIPDLVLRDGRQILDSQGSKRARARVWTRVRGGLMFVYAGVILGGGSFLTLILGELGVLLVLDLIGPQFFGLGWVPTPDFNGQMLWWGIGIGTIFYAGGFWACLGTPAPRTTRWLVGQVLCLIFFIISGCAVASHPFFQPAGWMIFGPRLTVYMAASLLVPPLAGALASVVCFVCYLRNLGKYLANSNLARSSASYLVVHLVWLPATCLCCTLVLLHASEFQFADKPDPSIAALACWFLALIVIAGGGGIVSLVWTLRLLREAWTAIGREQ